MNIKHPDVQPVGSLEDVMKKIEFHCNDDATGSISLFKDTKRRDLKDRQRQSEYAANVVYDALMYTLSEIGLYAVDRAKSKVGVAQDYESVARAIEPLSAVCRALADDQIPLRRNISLEQLRREEGDLVYAYKVNNITINNVAYKEIRVFIRPKKYEMPIALKRQRIAQDVQIFETAQARMMIDIIPADTRQSVISLRTDREDAFNDYKITYDIEIGPKEDNLMDRLDFSNSQANQINTGQRDTHHFSSQLTENDLGVTFAEILETMNRKFSIIANR